MYNSYAFQVTNREHCIESSNFTPFLQQTFYYIHEKKMYQIALILI